MIEDEELGIKIGTPDEAFWTDIKEKTERDIEILRKQLKYDEAVLEMCAFRLSLEAKKDENDIHRETSETSL